MEFFGGWTPEAAQGKEQVKPPVGHLCLGGDHIADGDEGVLVPHLVYDPSDLSDYVLVIQGETAAGPPPGYYTVWHRQCFQRSIGIPPTPGRRAYANEPGC